MRATPLLPLWAVRSVQSLRARTRVQFIFHLLSLELYKLQLQNCLTCGAILHEYYSSETIRKPYPLISYDCYRHFANTNSKFWINTSTVKKVINLAARGNTLRCSVEHVYMRREIF